MVFKGEDCVEKFGELLLDGTHQGAIVIAHNSRSYDSYFLCEYFYKECLLESLAQNIWSYRIEERLLSTFL